MRTLLALLLVTLWIGCGPAGRGGDDSPAFPDACQGIACAVVDCAKQGRPETTISGTVFAPNRTLPLFGVTVYVPGRDPGLFTDGVECSRCSNSLPGDPIVQTQSDPAGKFKLTGVPAGTDIPLVITVGKWRRKIVIPVVPECTDTALPTADTALPGRKADGEMPKIAMVTGLWDALECLVRKLGVADSEFTNDTGNGRIHLFASNGANMSVTGQTFAPAGTLWGSLDKLKQYDLAVFSCEGSQLAGGKPQSAMNAVKAYADLGGRVFLSHFQSVWISGENGAPTHAPPVWPTVASCNVNMAPSGTTGIIDEVNNPRGPAFATWMLNVMGSTLPGQFPITSATQTCTSLESTKAERWVTLQSGTNQVIQNFQFTTPNEVINEDRCGKVVMSDMHVSSDSSSDSGRAFPGGCSAQPLTPQERALAFMFFDIASCVGPIL